MMDAPPILTFPEATSGAGGGKKPAVHRNSSSYTVETETSETRSIFIFSALAAYFNHSAPYVVLQNFPRKVSREQAPHSALYLYRWRKRSSLRNFCSTANLNILVFEKKYIHIYFPKNNNNKYINAT